MSYLVQNLIQISNKYADEIVFISVNMQIIISLKYDVRNIEVMVDAMAN